MKVAVDARMYNMSGIGTYIQNLMKNGLYDIAIGKKEELEDIKEIEKIIEFDSPIYGIKEQLKFPILCMASLLVLLQGFMQKL